MGGQCPLPNCGQCPLPNCGATSLLVEFFYIELILYSGLETIAQRISAIYKRISHSVMCAGRDPHEVKLIAVSKGVGVEAIKSAIDAGLRVFGENRVKEALEKSQILAGLKENIEWHMIGHLQRNKVKTAVGLFELIHSVDSISLAEAIERHSGTIGKLQRVLIEVKLSPEPTKTGIELEGLEPLIKAIKDMKNIKLEGLMTMPPYSENPEDSRPFYRRLREIAQSYGLRELSMGMSGDFEIAIEEGSTMVRIGSAIFGERR